VVARVGVPLCPFGIIGALGARGLSGQTISHQNPTLDFVSGLCLHGCPNRRYARDGDFAHQCDNYVFAHRHARVLKAS
jgi:hypothetical protein